MVLAKALVVAIESPHQINESGNRDSLPERMFDVPTDVEFLLCAECAEPYE